VIDSVNINKKTAVLLYDSFCNFEISVALELLALTGKRIVIFGKQKEPVCSEEGLRVLPDASLEEDLAEMVGWDDNLRNPVEEGYIISDNIITSVSYNFVRWALGFGKKLGIDIAGENFGVK